MNMNDFNYIFIPIEKIKIVEKFIDDYPIYIDLKTYIKEKSSEDFYKKLPLYLVFENKIDNNNKRILTELITDEKINFYLYGEAIPGLIVEEFYTHITKDEQSVGKNFINMNDNDIEKLKLLIEMFINDSYKSFENKNIDNYLFSYLRLKK